MLMNEIMEEQPSPKKKAQPFQEPIKALPAINNPAQTRLRSQATMLMNEILDDVPVSPQASAKVLAPIVDVIDSEESATPRIEKPKKVSSKIKAKPIHVAAKTAFKGEKWAGVKNQHLDFNATGGMDRNS